MANVLLISLRNNGSFLSFLRKSFSKDLQMALRIALFCILLLAQQEARANDDIINLFGKIVSEALDSQDRPRSKEGIDWNDDTNQNGLSNDQLEKPASKSAVSKKRQGLCLSSLCIGMTIDEALNQEVLFKDGRITRNEEQVETRKTLEDHHGKRNVSREIDRLGGLPSYERDPDSKKMQRVMNLNSEERSYLSTFYPDRGRLASLDSRALSYLDKATMCAYLQVSATAEMKDGRSVDIRFLPLGENFELVIVRMIRQYDYFGAERDIFEKNLHSQYDDFSISYDPYASDRPDIVVSMGERHQSLILLHSDWWNVAVFASKGLSANAEKQFTEMLQRQNGCYRKEAPI